MKLLPFTEKEQKQGKDLFKKGAVRSIIFSGGTYLAEVVQGEDALSPFLQMDHEGQIVDSFCSCSEKAHCVHLAAAYFAIFKEARKPLHARFGSSFWNELCKAASRHHGYRADTLIGEKRREARLVDNTLVFFIEPLNGEGKEKLEEILENRPFETEETSLKFSNLSEEELSLWRSGNPSDSLRYELSFWSDLAKWIFSLAEEGREYKVEFSPKDKLPSRIKVTFDAVRLEFHVSESDLIRLIPGLKAIKSPFFVREAADLALETVEYDRKERVFIIQPAIRQAEPFPVEEGIDIGTWTFIPNKGFVSKNKDAGLKVGRVETSQVEKFIQEHTGLLKKHLKERIHNGLHTLQNRLYFDNDLTLHAELYLFEPGDCAKEESAFFGRWLYLQDEGFFYIRPPVFAKAETTVRKEDLSDFIKKHRNWLNGIEGFHIHLTSIESRLSYELLADRTLEFCSHIDMLGENTEGVDLGDRVYLPGKGFFPKRKEGETPELFAGLRVEEAEIPHFLSRHRKELGYVSSFFHPTSPIEKMSINISLQKEGVVVEPVFAFAPEYLTREVLFFGQYTYVNGEGFAKISCAPPYLEKYIEKKILSDKEALALMSHMKELEPWVENLDPRLRTPSHIDLQLSEMTELEEGRSKFWKMALSYKTDIGFVTVHTLWQAMLEGKKSLFSEAGLIDLTSERFNWVRSLSKRKWVGKEKRIELGALEWIRIQSSEVVKVTEEAGESSEKTRKAFFDFQSGEGFRPLSTQGLKSTLRGYQETGLRWLWFLYCYGLSGILCDEMGLGKTHQAMALLAAASHDASQKRQKYLVVCPTSVIYHWQDLLRRYLPSLRVYVFYGQGRDPNKLSEPYDLILTSYGMVRTEKKHLGEIPFTIAVYDELQQAKNPGSQIHRALRSLRVGMTLGLTGTPIENGVLDIKALFDLVLPHYLPSDAYFKEHFVVPVEKEKDLRKKQLLAKMIRPFVLRRKKSEVLLELPEKTEEIAYCDLSDDQRDLYLQLFVSSREQIKQEIRNDPHSSIGMHIFALFSKLKQICDHPCLINGDVEHFHKYGSGKWDLFVELLEEAGESGQKVVVFTQYLKMMDIIKLHLKRNHIGYAEIRGGTRDRGAQLRKLQNDPDCKVFVASLQAAGVGIDLTAASVVIHYDRWWNPAKENQATDRVHRIGQSRGVQVFKLVTKKTIEERIHALIEEKMGFLDEVVGFDDQFVVKNFTKSELFHLFSRVEEDLQ